MATTTPKTEQEKLAFHLERKDATFKKLSNRIAAVPAEFKSQCPEQWATIDSLTESLGAMLGQVSELKGVVAFSPENKALWDALKEKHMNIKGGIGRYTPFGHQIDGIRIAVLNVQPVVPDEGDALTFQFISTLASIAEKTGRTAK